MKVKTSCPLCKGKRYLYETEQNLLITIPCPKCDAKGYIEKKQGQVT